MFGMPKGDKIKAAFQDFDSKVGTQRSPDPLVNILIDFIRALSEAFK